MAGDKIDVETGLILVGMVKYQELWIVDGRMVVSQESRHIYGRWGLKILSF